MQNFKEAAPLLFGPDFGKKSKEYTDQIKAMRSSITRPESKQPLSMHGDSSCSIIR